MQPFRTRPRRLVAFAAGVLVAAGLLVAPQAVLAAPTPPPNPTNGQLSRAQAAKNALADEVGRLSAEIAAKQQQVVESGQQVELAEQKVAYAVTEYRKSVDEQRRAVAAVAVAKQKLATATRRVDDSQRRFAQYMQAIYMDGSPPGLTGTLLTADDPTALLQQSNYEQYEASHNAGVIGRMQQLTVGKSNAAARARTAEAKARQAVAVTKQRKADSIVAQQNAVATYQRHQQEKAEFEQTQAATQTELDAKRSRLATLNGQRATYVAYVAEQKRLAEIRRQKRIAEQRRQAEIARQKREAAQRARNSGGGGGGGGSYNPPPSYSPPAPGNGNWTAAKAQRAVNRAESTLGTPYAWAGGGAGGPSYGACVPSAGAPYDCNIRGYDCSGLVMYAWGKDWDHYAATQYSQAGSVHPSRSNLRKGDLLFYSSNGTVGGIHHVAMYVGGGRIIEAPYSGGYVQYNGLYAYSDYFGATRPLT